MWRTKRRPERAAVLFPIKTPSRDLWMIPKAELVTISIAILGVRALPIRSYRPAAPSALSHWWINRDNTHPDCAFPAGPVLPILDCDDPGSDWLGRWHEKIRFPSAIPEVPNDRDQGRKKADSRWDQEDDPEREDAVVLPGFRGREPSLCRWGYPAQS